MGVRPESRRWPPDRRFTHRIDMTRPRILLTAFGSYPPWPTNSSWLTLVELTRRMPTVADMTTRRYPVDLGRLQSQLQRDLEAGFDFVIHLGQAPGESAISLEAIALNRFRASDEQPAEPLTDAGPLAIPCQLDVFGLSHRLREAQIPCRVSYHAGTFLCNAIFYWTAWNVQHHGWNTTPLLVHLPLATPQVLQQTPPMPSLPVDTLAHAVRLLVQQLAATPPARECV